MTAATKTNVLFVQGLPDDNSTQAVWFDGRIRHSFVGSANVSQGFAKVQGLRSKSITLLGNGPNFTVPRQQLPDVVFNEISDPDSNGLALRSAERFLVQLDGIPTINPPEMIRRSARDQLARQLQNNPCGVRVPPTFRCAFQSPAHVIDEVKRRGMRFPIIVRPAGMHGGKSLVRVDGVDDVNALHAFPFDGRDFYVTEFEEFQSRDGFYRKCRIIVVAGKPFARHLLIGPEWLVNATSATPLMRQRPELAAEEARFLANFEREIAPRIHPIICKIAETLQLEYFGIDCHLREGGELLLFEANANVNAVMTGHPREQITDTRAIIHGITAAVTELIIQKAQDGRLT